MVIDCDSRKFKSLSIVVFLIVALSFPNYLYAVVSNLVDFDDVNDLTDNFNDDGSPVFTNIVDSGINNTGSINVPLGSDDIWTTKQGYSVGGTGDIYTFSAFFKIKANSGRGGLGFAATSPSSGGIYSTPSEGIGVTFHGGGGEFINNGVVLEALSWPPDLVLGNWYWMEFAVENKGSNTFDLNFEIWNSDASGNIGELKTQKTYEDLENTEMGSANTIHGFFSASGSRMEKIDNFSIELEGSASIIEEGEPVVITGAVSSITSESADIAGQVTDDQGAAVTDRGICLDTSENPDLSDTCFESGTGEGSFDASASDLSDDTTYYARAYATNSEGTSYGAQRTFNTLEVELADNDGDGIDDSDEDEGNNGGDGNGDGTADSEQANVVNLPNPVTSGRSTLQLQDGDCDVITSATLQSEDDLSASDDDYEYPVGLSEFTIECDNPGDTATVTIFYDQVYDTTSWVVRKFNSFTGEYQNIDVITEVVVAPQNLENGVDAGTEVTTISYEVTDGSELDNDAEEPLTDGTIVDPVGPGVLIASSSSISSSGRRITLSNRNECDNKQYKRYPEKRGLGVDVDLFSDANESHRAYLALIDLAEQGIINGDEDSGYARLEGLINRAEVTKLLTIARQDTLALGECLQSSRFEDVNVDDWFHEFVQNIEQKRIIHGYEDGLYRPDQVINKAELFKMLAISFDFISQEEAIKSFEDGDFEFWYEPYFDILDTQKITPGFMDDIPADSMMKRGDVFVLLSNILRLIDDL